MAIAIAMGLLALLGVFLTAVYLSLTGALPFTFADGPAGIHPWLPILVLVGLSATACVVPTILRRFHDREITFRDQIAINDRNSVFLCVALIAGAAGTAYAIFTVVSLRTSVGLAAAAVTVALGIALAIVSYASGDRIVLRVSGARAADHREEQEIGDIVRELALAANVPPPRLMLMNAAAPNAFSTGRDPSRAILVVTTGLLDLLDREQMQGVVAHELAHIRNLDTRYLQFVAVLVGTTVLIADAFYRIVTLPFWAVGKVFERSDDGRIHGTGSAGDWSFPSFDLDLGDGGDSGGGGVALVLAIAIFVIMLIVVAWIVHKLAPVFARMVQASVSQEREYLADASAVEIGRNPAALEQALLKIDGSKEILEAANRATAPLYFVTPIRRFEKRAAGIFATHPPTLERVNRLRRLRGEPALDAGDVGELWGDLD